MKRVILISDDRKLSTKVKQVLNSEGLQTDRLPGKERILEELVKRKPDVVLIDFLLGEINGGALCHQLKIHPELCDLPIVLLTDDPNLEHFQARFGCDAALAKPVAVMELLMTLHRFTSPTNPN